eukprot:3063929-Pyramimonas_sp.AAC.2
MGCDDRYAPVRRECSLVEHETYIFTAWRSKAVTGLYHCEFPPDGRCCDLRYCMFTYPSITSTHSIQSIIDGTMCVEPHTVVIRELIAMSSQKVCVSSSATRKKQKY